MCFSEYNLRAAGQGRANRPMTSSRERERERDTRSIRAVLPQAVKGSSDGEASGMRAGQCVFLIRRGPGSIKLTLTRI